MLLMQERIKGGDEKERTRDKSENGDSKGTEREDRKQSETAPPQHKVWRNENGMKWIQRS